MQLRYSCSLRVCQVFGRRALRSFGVAICIILMVFDSDEIYSLYVLKPDAIILLSILLESW